MDAPYIYFKNWRRKYASSYHILTLLDFECLNIQLGNQ